MGVAKTAIPSAPLFWFTATLLLISLLSLSLQDIKPSARPDFWDDRFGQRYWIQGTVVGLPKSEGLSTRFELHTHCWLPYKKEQAFQIATSLSRHQRRNCHPPAALKKLRLKYRHIPYQARNTTPTAIFETALTRTPTTATTRTSTTTLTNNADSDFSVVQLKPGIRAWFAVKVKAPRGQVNPGAWDYEKWLFVNRIGGLGYVLQGEPILLSKQLITLDRVRDRISVWLRSVAPAHTKAHALLPALIVGDRRGLDNHQWQLLNDLGIGHLLAISGLHIGLVAAIAFAVISVALSFITLFYSRLFLLAPKVMWSYGSAVLVSFGYCCLAGWTIPTQRAFLTLSVLMIFRGLQLPLSLGQAWCLAAMSIIAISFRSLFDVGFALSFGAVALLLCLLNRQHHSSDLVQTTFWLRIPKRLLGLFKLQLSLSFALIPLTLFFFHQIVWLSPIVNVVMIPLVGMVLIPALIGLLGIKAFTDLLQLQSGDMVINALLSFVVEGVESSWRVLEWLAAFKLTSTMVITSPIAWCCLVIALWGFLFVDSYRWRSLIVVCCLLLALAIVNKEQATIQAGEFRLAVLDIGQGLATVLETQEHVMVYDTGAKWGSASAAHIAIEPYLRFRQQKKIDRMVLSHLDQDHAGAAFALSKLLPIEQEQSFKRQSAASQWSDCYAGQRWVWDGVTFEVLFPKKSQNREIRNLSCVIKVTGQHHSVLLTGDMSSAMEGQLMERHPNKTEVLKADVLLVPHHGSRSSSSTGFLNRVQPTIAIAAYGWKNRFHHPHPSVLKRYQNRGIPVYGTAEQGALVLDSSKAEMSLNRYRLSSDWFWKVWRYTPASVEGE